MKQLKKKGAIDQLANLITALGVLAILIAVIFLIIGETKSMVIDQDVCNSTGTYNATSGECCQSGNCSLETDHYSYSYLAQEKIQATASDIPGWLPIIVITVIGGILLMLVRFFKSN